MKIQSWLKSLSQKYDPYLTWVLMTLVIISIPSNIYMIYKDISLDRQRKQAEERLDDSLAKADKLSIGIEQKQDEIDQVNLQIKECLNNKKSQINQCENLLNRTTILHEETQNLLNEYKSIIDKVDQDYCFLYPDDTRRNCQNKDQ
ncbi:MAG: hypothetical protein EAZ76_09520 [Nostocales cyanobacterium]|nr:MAG: hypothetical protein EAZ87_03720 [Nostocales cyanobacterium]TAF14520.1 MAG: hypothetical protein EAZ76_09520 [Nostocales cyanobacterium]